MLCSPTESFALHSVPELQAFISEFCALQTSETLGQHEISWKCCTLYGTFRKVTNSKGLREKRAVCALGASVPHLLQSCHDPTQPYPLDQQGYFLWMDRFGIKLYHCEVLTVAGLRNLESKSKCFQNCGDWLATCHALLTRASLA